MCYIDAPVINSIKKEVLVYLGHDAELPCNAIGIPDVYHRWKDQKGAVIKNQGRFKIASNGSLLISKVELKDGMNYTCAPYNDVGDGNPRHSSLVILSKLSGFRPMLHFISMLSCILRPADIYLFKVNNGNTRTTCTICLKLTIKKL